MKRFRSPVFLKIAFPEKIFFENENQEIKETIFTEEMLNFLTT